MYVKASEIRFSVWDRVEQHDWVTDMYPRYMYRIKNQLVSGAYSGFIALVF